MLPVLLLDIRLYPYSRSYRLPHTRVASPVLVLLSYYHWCHVFVLGTELASVLYLHHTTQYASMLAAATSFFARTAISQSYNIGTAGSRPSTPGHATTSLTHPTPSLYVGLWRVQSAYHKVTNKRVSVWSFDKRSTDIERLSPLARERTLEVLKAEVEQLSIITLFLLNGALTFRLLH